MFIIGSWLSVCGFLNPTMVLAEENEPRYFDEPPSAETLADTLFPMQYRSLGSESVSEDAGEYGAFGMPIHFEFGNSTIVPESLPFIDAVGDMLNLEGLESSTLIIEGHTDAVGSPKDNQALSEARAAAVRQYLVSVFSIDSSRLTIVGKGESELLDVENPNGAVNRRVQFRASNGQ